MIALHVLASGSKGNASIVENVQTHEGVLIDCGICKRDFMNGCDEVGFDPSRLRAILISHDHSDHTKGLGVVLRGLAKMNIRPPLFTSHQIRKYSRPIEEAVNEGAVFVPVHASDTLDLAGMSIQIFKTSHDAAESFGFRFDCSAGRSKDALGFMTDTGIITPEAHEALQYVRILALESNHDAKMLKNGPYPAELKKRVASNHGHLSNEQAAGELESLLTSLGGSMLEHVIAMHISENNNTYSLPKQTLRSVVEKLGYDASVHVAYQKMVVSIR